MNKRLLPLFLLAALGAGRAVAQKPVAGYSAVCAVGWTDWNVLLDETGGPNHVGNFCFAPVIADTKAGKLIYTNAYHYTGHFSKFIRPGAQRIVSSSNRDALQTTAFRNPNGSVAVVVMNQTDKPLDYQLWLNGQAAKTTAAPHSIMTVVVD